MLSHHPNLTHTKGNGGARIPDALEVLRITEATSAKEVTTTKTVDISKIWAEVALELLLGTGNLLGVVRLKVDTKYCRLS